MSGNVPYSLHPLPIIETTEAEDLDASNTVHAQWLASTAVTYEGQYMTPFPTTALENQPWTTYAKPLMTDVGTAPTSIGTTFPMQQYYPYNPLNRPRSSPSTFGIGPENITWPTTTGLGIQYPPELPIIPATTSMDVFSPAPDMSIRHSPEVEAPIPRRPYPMLAPHPAGLAAAAAKRQRDEDEDSDPGSSSKRRKRTASGASVDLSEDDRYLVQLKEDDDLTWKEIATRFAEEKGKTFHVPALQMRYKRLREKYRVWEEQDIQALKLAYEYWNKNKWDIISQKMSDFGVIERWPARSCARKWLQFETTMALQAGLTPAMTQFASSPVVAPVQFTFVPMQ